MAVGVRFKYVGGLQRQDAVHHHAAAVAEQDAQRQVLVVALARDDLVDAILGKEVGPTVQFKVIDGVDIVDQQVLNLLTNDRVSDRGGV